MARNTLGLLAIAVFGCDPGPSRSAATPPVEIRGAAMDAPVAAVEPPAPPVAPAPPVKVVELPKEAPVSVKEPTPPPIELNTAPVPVPGEEDPPKIRIDLPIENGCFRVTFGMLAGFRYAPPLRKNNKPVPRPDPLPAGVRALDGQKVVLDGFMIPVQMVKGKATRFLVARNTLGCCFGDTPPPTGYIPVDLKDGSGVAPASRIRVEGTISVGEEFDDEGWLDSVYRITADRATAVDE